MFSPTLKNTLKSATLIFFFIFSLTRLVFSQDKNLELTQLQEQALAYRQEGLRLQQRGDLEKALNFYQKAVQLDPSFAPCYNDMGIIYEAMGAIDKAEENYLRCVKIDPDYASAYTNLAIINENKRDLKKAIFYWQKRKALGTSDDPWVIKAKERVSDMNMVLSDKPLQAQEEQEVFSLMNDVRDEKILLRQDNQLLSSKHFEKAKKSFERGDFATAIKEALDAQQLDPANEEIEKFIEKVQLRVLSR